MVCVTVAVVSMTIRPQVPAISLHTSTSVPESVGRPPRPWVKIPSSTVNGLRYMSTSVITRCLLTLELQFCIAVCVTFHSYASFSVTDHTQYYRLEMEFVLVSGTVTAWELQHLPNPNVLVAISKVMWAVKLHQQNPPILNWRRLLMQVDLRNRDVKREPENR